MPLAIPLIVLLALLVSMGYAATAASVSKGFTSWMPGWLKKAAFFALPVAQQVVRLTRYLTHELGKHFSAIEAQGVRWFSELAHYVDVVGYWSLYWPIGLAHEVEHLTRKVIPRAINARTRPLSRRIDVAEAEAKAAAGIAHTLPKTVKAHDRVKTVTEIQTVAMPHAGEWDWIHRHFKTLEKVLAGVAAAAVAIPVAHAPSFPIPWRRTARDLSRRLGRVEKLLGVAALTLAISRVLGVGKGCLRGDGNLGKTARRLCGMNSNLLDSLLLDGLAIVGALSVVEFANELRAIEDEALTIVGGLVSEWPS